MPRTVSWLPRLHEIRRSVTNSVRSHYDRGDLEQLFQLQPRAAQKLLELLPTLQVGTSRLIDREVLAGFLDRVQDAEDPSALFDQVRQEKAAVSRRKPRSLVRRDLDPVSLASLPASIALSRGRLEISFRSVEHLAESLLMIARILENEGDDFARAYEPEVPTSGSLEKGEDMGSLWIELRKLEEGAARLDH